MYTKTHHSSKWGHLEFLLPPKKSEEPDELQKVGDFISGPFILPFVIAIVTRPGGFLCVFFVKVGKVGWRICRGVSFFEKNNLERRAMINLEAVLSKYIRYIYIH